MKKLILFTLTVLFVMSLSIVSMANGGMGGEAIEEKSPQTEGICPETKVMGDVNACFRCHAEKTFKIKEVTPFEEWNLPNHRSSMIMENGQPVGYYMVETVTGSIGECLNDFLLYLNVNHPEVKKIIMEIHSPGGSLFDGYKTVGVIKYWQSKGYVIETRVHGFAASAGFLIFCAGNPRLVSPQSQLMWHELITFSMFEVSGPADKEDQAKVLRHLQDTANIMIAEISTLTKEELDAKIRKKELWVRGSEAVEFGFATGLMDNKKGGGGQVIYVSGDGN